MPAMPCGPCAPAGSCPVLKSPASSVRSLTSREVSELFFTSAPVNESFLTFFPVTTSVAAAVPPNATNKANTQTTLANVRCGRIQDMAAPFDQSQRERRSLGHGHSPSHAVLGDGDIVNPHRRRLQLFRSTTFTLEEMWGVLPQRRELAMTAPVSSGSKSRRLPGSSPVSPVEKPSDEYA